MVAILIFAAVTGVAIALGLGAYLLLRHFSLWVSIPVTILTALLAITFSALAYYFASFSFPATDGLDWAALDKIEAYVDLSKKDRRIDDRVRKKSVGRCFNGRCFSSSDASVDTSDIKIVVAYPSNTRTGDDVTLALTISALTSSFAQRQFKATIHSGETLKTWTTQTCNSNAVGSVACASIPLDAKSFDFVWTISPTAGGRRQLAIELPELWSGNQWTAVVIARGDVLSACWPRDFDCGRTPKLFSSAETSYSAPPGDFSLDFGRREIRFPIEVATTLGLSSSAYAWLAVIG